MTRADHDVLVLGGGLTGLLFARLLADAAGPSLRVAILESGAAPREPAPGEAGSRVLAIAPGSRDLLAAAGAWPATGAAERCGYRRMVVWHGPDGRGPGAGITFDAADAGVAALGFICDHDHLRHDLWVATGGLERRCGVAMTGIAREEDALRVDLAAGGPLRARLVVAADGARSAARAALGVQSTVVPYGQRAVVAHFATGRPHDDTAWQRFLPGGPLALLPMADGRVSLVWSAPEDEAARLLALGDDEFAALVTERSDAVLGRLVAASPRAAFPLARAHAEAYTGPRFALVGDAAHQVHPLAGLGVNLGFQDAAALARVLVAHLAHRGADPGDPLALRRYERERRGPNLVVQRTMDALHRLFSAGGPALAAVAGTGMHRVGQVPALRRWLAAAAMGAGLGAAPSPVAGPRRFP